MKKEVRKKMKRGFTLIELVMVIVILGILAATALPRFVDLSLEAHRGATLGALGGIRTAVAITYASNAVYGSIGFPGSIYQSLFADSIIPRDTINNTNAVEVVATSPPTGTTGGWRYASNTGKVWINHTDYSTY